MTCRASWGGASGCNLSFPKLKPTSALQPVTTQMLNACSRKNNLPQVSELWLKPGKRDEDCSGRCCSEDPGSHSGHRGTFCSEIFNEKEFVQVSNLNDKGTFCSEHPVVKLCQVYSFRRSTSKVAPHQSSQLTISVDQVIFVRGPEVIFLRPTTLWFSIFVSYRIKCFIPCLAA